MSSIKAIIASVIICIIVCLSLAV
ncbi:lysis protein, partial [Salmonella enterica subsp. enterica serovar Worthington]|nr:lysis protein [Salmonella enterica]EAW2293536.1 lysis protein [Salmonella enterica subsp. enterica]EBL6408362.1 lysis protein [Salmonella enterica subsp. enterica serovar Mbandaka]EDK8029579.1 lysis protein [Salmonella enterica subsp. enterica serovar Typhimurium]EDS8949643.1 lysis protein [Salmonella enterica subsp. enterica serovar Worthington]